MSKKTTPLEALERIINAIDDYVYISCDLGKEYKIIERKLKRLEELEKAFISLSKEDEKTKKLLSKEIEKNRALDIIKEKRVDVCYFMNCRTLEEYNDDVLASYAYEEVDAEQRMLTQEEYDLLKEELL